MQKIEKIAQLHTGNLVLYKRTYYVVLGIGHMDIKELFRIYLYDLDSDYYDIFTLNRLYELLLQGHDILLYPVIPYDVNLDGFCTSDVILADPYLLTKTGYFDKGILPKQMSLYKTKLAMLGFYDKETMGFEDAKKELKLQYVKIVEDSNKLLIKYTKESSKKIAGMLFYKATKNPFSIDLYVSLGKKDKTTYFILVKSYPVLQLDALDWFLDNTTLAGLIYIYYIQSAEFKIIRDSNKLKPLGLKVHDGYLRYITKAQREKLSGFKEINI